MEAAISRRWRMAGAAGLESVQGLGNGPSHCIRVEDWNAKSINITSRRRPSRHPDATRTLCRHPSSRRTNHLRKLSIDKLPTFTYPTIIASTIQPPHRSRVLPPCLELQVSLHLTVCLTMMQARSYRAFSRPMRMPDWITPHI